MFSGSMVGKVVGLALNLVLTRGFGPALFGVYSLGLTVLRFVREIGTLGLQNGVVRFAAPAYEGDDPATVKGTFLAVGALGVGAGILLGGALYWAAPWLATDVFRDAAYTRVFRIFAVGLPFFILTYLASRMARALGRMEVDVLLSSILQPAIFLTAVCGIVLLGYGFTTALYAFVASTVLAGAASIYAVLRLFPPLATGLRPEIDLRALLRFSIPIVGVSLASIGLTYTDRIMLGIFSTSEAIGIYQAAAQTSVQLRFGLFAVSAAFSPLISDLFHNEKRQLLADLYADTVRWILLLTLPLGIVAVTFAPEIMSIYGPGFVEGGNLLRVLSLTYLVVIGVGSVGHMLQMSDHQDFVLVVNSIMALLNVALNWILIQAFGAMGAALATAFTQALGNVVQVVALHRFIDVHPFRWNLWKPVAAAVVGALAAWVCYTQLPAPYYWVVGIPCSGLVYAGVVVGLGLTEKDRSIVTDVWARIRGRG